MPSDILVQFLTVATAHLLAVASPGPDFSVVMRESIRYGRTAGLWTSAGVGSGILIHTSYAILGVGVILRGTPGLFDLLKYAGAAYLIYLGFQCLRAAPLTIDSLSVDRDNAPGRRWPAFRIGFLTNLLNPKATLFFVALFSAVVGTHTPLWLQGLYSAWMVLATVAWFGLVTLLFSNSYLRQRFLAAGHWIERVTGAILIILAIVLIASEPG